MLTDICEELKVLRSFCSRHYSFLCPYHFQFDDDYATPKRYRVPLDLTLPTTGADNPLYDVAVSSTNNLALKITRKSTGKVM